MQVERDFPDQSRPSPRAGDADRAAAYPAWLHHYNHHRGHTSLKGRSPIDRVLNLPGQNI